MRSFVVGALDALLTFVFLVMLIAGFIGGVIWGGVIGAILGLGVVFLFGVVFFGGLFLLLDINANLRIIRDNLARGPN